METTVFAEKNLQKFRGFFGGKDRFVIKIPVLTPKTRFSIRKEYFTSEIVFYSLNLSFRIEILQKFRGFFDGKDHWVKKSTSFSTKTRFSRRKEYFTSEIVFYSGNLSFFREKLVEVSCFFRWKRPFRNNNTSFNTENEVFSKKRVLYIWNSILQWKPEFLYRKTCRNFVFFFVGKDRFVIKIPVLTPKTRFSSRKEYFTSEIVFYSGNLSFCREKLAEIPGFFLVEKTVS